MRSTKQVKYADSHCQTIVLIGFMGCGKSTLGRQLGARLDLVFTDLDQALVRQAGRSIAQIFEKEGEEGFRSRETQALKAALRPGQVIALGGGTVLRPENRQILKRANAIVVWIDVPWAELWRRLSKLDARRRPLLWNTDEERPKSEGAVKALFLKRRGIYKKIAKITVRVSARDDEQASPEKLTLAVN